MPFEVIRCFFDNALIVTALTFLMLLQPGDQAFSPLPLAAWYHDSLGSHHGPDGSRKKVSPSLEPSNWWLTSRGTSYPQLVGVRVCLGIAEAGLFPGVVY